MIENIIPKLATCQKTFMPNKLLISIKITMTKTKTTIFDDYNISWQPHPLLWQLKLTFSVNLNLYKLKFN